MSQLGLGYSLIVEWWVEAHSTSPDTVIESTSRFYFRPPEDVLIPTEFALYQNYPNPFNLTTTIRYDVKETAIVSLKIFNLCGQEVATLVRSMVVAGSYTTTWNAMNFSSGIYFCRMETPEFVQTRKVVLVR